MGSGSALFGKKVYRRFGVKLNWPCVIVLNDLHDVPLLIISSAQTTIDSGVSITVCVNHR